MAERTDNFSLEGVDSFPSELNPTDTVSLDSFEGLEAFQSESQLSLEASQTGPPIGLSETLAVDAPPVPNGRREGHGGSTWAALAATILLAVGIPGVLFWAKRGEEHSVSERSVTATEVEVPPVAEGSRPQPAKSAPAVPAAIGSAGEARDTRVMLGPRKPGTVDARRRRAAMRSADQQRVERRAGDAQVARAPRGGIDEIVTSPPPPARAASPAAAVEETNTVPIDERSRESAPVREAVTLAPETGALVTVTTNSNSNALTFRWSAPVGRFADPTARQTRFFCPDTPQSVEVTVTVTDPQGASARDTMTVQCVAGNQ